MEGGVKVGVVTPYYGEGEGVLRRCIESVKVQDAGLTIKHYLIADGVERDWVRNVHGVVDVRLPHFGDYGNTPRCVGAALAQRDGCDALCFLDADNWYEPDHIGLLSGLLVSENVDVVTCGRNLYREDGTFLAVDHENDGNAFVDTNCYLIGKRAFPLMVTWMFHPSELTVIGDRIVWNCLKQNALAGEIKITHSDKPTVNYTTLIASHYFRNGEHPPRNAKEIVVDHDGQTTRVLNYDEFMKLKRITQ